MSNNTYTQHIVQLKNTKMKKQLGRIHTHASEQISTRNYGFYQLEKMGNS